MLYASILLVNEGNPNKSKNLKTDGCFIFLRKKRTSKNGNYMQTNSKEIFTKSTLISNLDVITQDFVFEQSIIENFDPDTIILQQGNIGTSFYILLDGTVQVLQEKY